jgi:hypothetical protein
MTSSLSPHISLRNHLASIVRNAIGSTARNVTNDFVIPSDQNALLTTVTDSVPNASVTATTPSSIINKAQKIFCNVDSYKGFEVEPEMVCILCEAAIHDICLE